MYNGYKLKSVLNITDVGHLVSDRDTGVDKMTKAAKEKNQTPEQIADFYTKAFFKDTQRLNVLPTEIVAKATDNIPEMLNIVGALVEKGYAYETKDGIYFDIAKFPDYGKLSRMKIDDQLAGARVNINTGKRHPADFALWKKAEPNHIMRWDSPWGKSYPGWHIECTAMSIKYLGDEMDIHTGGIDHVPIHHENEIAQAEAYLEHKQVNYWMHSEFMLVNGGKMSKSLKNVYTVDDLISKGYSPMDFRYFCLNAQYRQKLNFTWEGMDAAKTAYDRLIAHLAVHKNSAATTDGAVLAEIENEFHKAINDDLNVPMAMGVLWKAAKLHLSNDIYELALKMDGVFGLSFESSVKETTQKTDVPQEVTDLANERLNARKEKNWTKSDELRDKIASFGYTVKDTANGFEIEEK
jgi:cysteinyl-tRNA synthetase